MSTDLRTAVRRAIKMMLLTYVVLLVIVAGIAVMIHGQFGLLSAAVTGLIAAMVMGVTMFSLHFVSQHVEYAQGLLMGAFAVKIAIVFISILLVMQAKTIVDGRIIFIGVAVFITVISIVEALTLGRSRVSTLDAKD